MTRQLSLALVAAAGLLACGKSGTSTSSTAAAAASTATASSSTAAGSTGATGTTASSSSGSTTGRSTSSSGASSTSGTSQAGSTSGSTGSTGAAGSTGGSTGGGSGEQCASAARLTEGAPVSGDTSAAADDYHFADGAASCTGYLNVGPDLVYAFTPAASGRYVFTLSGLSYDGAFYLLDACPPTQDGSGNLLGCPSGADAQGSGTDETFTASLVGGTTYFVVVDGYSSSSSGTFSLSVAAAPPPPANDTCAAPEVLVAGTPASGDTSQASNDYAPASGTGGCPDGAGPDVVYSFTAGSTARYLFTLTPGSSFDGNLYLLGACPTSSAVPACLAGADRSSAGGAERLVADLTAGTTYFVVVDASSSTSSGSFTLEAGLAPPPPTNEGCAAPEALSLGSPASGDTTFAAADLAPLGCGSTSASGSDLTYSFTPASDGRYLFTVTPAAGFDPILSVFAGCPAAGPDGGSLAACLGGADEHGSGSAEVVSANLTAGTPYLVVVDGYSNSVGSFTVQVDPAPGNEDCAAPVALTVGTPASGDTSAAANDLAPNGCGSGNASGPDLTYSLTAPSDGRYRLTLTPAGWDAILSAYSGCPAGADGGAGGACLGGADDHGSGSAEEVTVTLLAGQTALVVVDGYGSGAGPFTLLAEALAPPGPGDTCLSPLPLASHAAGDPAEQVPGSLADAGSDGAGSCGGAYGDQVYALTLTGQVSLQASATLGDGGPAPVSLYLRADCGSAGSELACADNTAGPLSLPRLGGADGGTFYLWVDGTSSDAADYTLSLQLGAPVPAPAGDLCADAQPLALDSTVSLDTSAATDDFHPAEAGGCAGGGTGPELFYAFTAPATGSYEATLTPAAGVDAVLQLLDACPAAPDSAACLGGADQNSTGGAEVLRFAASAGQVVLLVADGWGGDRGTFTLSVTQVVLPAGDSCAALGTADGGSHTVDLAAGALPDGGALLSFASDTTGLADDAQSDSSGDCGGVGSGPDEVFQVLLPGPVPSLTARVDPGAGGNDSPVAYFRSAPCTDARNVDGGGGELACAYTSGGVAVVSTGPLDGGTVFLWIDGYSGSQGPATVTLTVP